MMRVRELQTVYRVRALDVDPAIGRHIGAPEVAKAICAALKMPNGERLDAQPVEHFCALALTTKYRVLSYGLISIGTLDATIVHPREVFAFACAARAAAIVVTHNHPSGDLTPSPDDIELTRRLLAVGTMIQIPVLDHIIVGHQGGHSLREAGTV